MLIGAFIVLITILMFGLMRQKFNFSKCLLYVYGIQLYQGEKFQNIRKRSVKCFRAPKNYYRPQRSCEGYVFTPVCLSTGGVCLSACWDTNPRDQTPPWDQTPPRDQAPSPGPGNTPWDQTSPPRPGTSPTRPPWDLAPPGSGTPPRNRHPPETATVAEGTHPLYFSSNRTKIVGKTWLKHGSY